MARSHLAESVQDQYFTPFSIAKELCNEVETVLGSNIRVFEPSVGSGIFPKSKPEFHWTTNELFPQEGFKPDLVKDFLELQPTEKFDAVIGNPPFGRNSKLAKQFVIHSANFSDTVAMILPSSMIRFTTQKMINSRSGMKVAAYKSLGMVDFEIPGNEPRKVSVCYQIWQKSNEKFKLKNGNFLKISDTGKWGIHTWSSNKEWGEDFLQVKLASQIKSNKCQWIIFDGDDAADQLKSGPIRDRLIKFANETRMSIPYIGKSDFLHIVNS